MKKSAVIIAVLLVLAGISVFTAYQVITDWPGRRIIHIYMEAKGINIRSGTPEYATFMRRIVWGEITELRQISRYVKTQEELDAVLRYAFKYSGYQKQYGNYNEAETLEAKSIITSPTIQQRTYTVTPASSAIGTERQQILSTPSLKLPIHLTATVTPEPTEQVYLIASETMIVRSAPDVNADAIGRIPAEQAYAVMGRSVDWWLIDLGGDQSGWIYGATSRTQLTGERARVPTVDLPSPRFVTPTPLCTPQSVDNIEQVLDDAQSILVAFFDLLSKKEYAQAAKFYGGDYYMLRDHNPLVDPKDYATLFQHACEINGAQCFQVKQVVNVKALSPYKFELMVEFKLPDGSLFVRGPCCGADETQQPSLSRWTYTVILDCQGGYFVMELPPYWP